MQISVPSTGDLVAIQIGIRPSKVTLFGLYIDSNHSNTLHLLDDYLHAHMATTAPGPSNHMFWCSDFNRHHLLWDKECNRHLFTAAA